MTPQPFDNALAFTLPAEGGYVDDHYDHGGPTNHGITQAVYDDWRDEQKLPRQSVMLLTDAETTRIYQERYWTTGRCDGMPLKLAVVHFDWCVNHGVSGAIETLQQTVGVESDGIWGPATAAAVAAAPADMYYAYINARRAWYTNRCQVKPDQGHFLPDWMKRCDQLQRYAEAL